MLFFTWDQNWTFHDFDPLVLVIQLIISPSTPPQQPLEIKRNCNISQLCVTCCFYVILKLYSTYLSSSKSLITMSNRTVCYFSKLILVHQSALSVLRSFCTFAWKLEKWITCASWSLNTFAPTSDLFPILLYISVFLHFAFYVLFPVLYCPLVTSGFLGFPTLITSGNYLTTYFFH